LGNELNDRVKRYTKEVRAAGTSTDTTVVMASGETVVRRTDKNLLKENGGPIDISKSWAKSLLSWMGHVKCKACSTAKLEPSHYEQLKEQFLLDIKIVVEMEDIPADLILNWDHTGINIVPGCPWTMEEKGAKRVNCVGLDDKCQITTVICVTLSGLFLPLQIIYQGKTAASLPIHSFPSVRQSKSCYLCLLYSSKSYVWPSLTRFPFFLFGSASTASLAALIVDDGNTSDNGPSGSGRFLVTGLKYCYKDILLERHIHAGYKKLIT